MISRGTDDELGKTVGSPQFAETCIGFFHQAIKNHYYGFDRINCLYETPFIKIITVQKMNLSVVLWVF